MGEGLEGELTFVKGRFGQGEFLVGPAGGMVGEAAGWGFDGGRPQRFLVVGGPGSRRWTLIRGVRQLGGREVGLGGEGRLSGSGGALTGPHGSVSCNDGDADEPPHRRACATSARGPPYRGLAVAQVRSEPDVGAHERTVACAAASGS